MTEPAELRVAVDVGSRLHRVALGNTHGAVLEEFNIPHTQSGFNRLFERLSAHGAGRVPCAIAMEGYNGYARPLDRQVLHRGFRLFNVNNVKLARFKEIFPAAAKSDSLDARKMLELFQLQTHLPLAKGVLQEIGPIPAVHDELKWLTRRRKQLIRDKIVLIGRLHAALLAVSPGLADITGSLDNRWFLRFISCRTDLRQLARLRRSSLLKIRGIGNRYADTIVCWQASASFDDQTAWASATIIDDARAMLALIDKLKGLEARITELLPASPIARPIRTLPGFGPISAAELAAEIGNLDRFAKEASLALYLGVAPLTHSSGLSQGTRSPKQVNVHAKATMSVATVRHMRQVAQSRAYYDRKRAEGKTHQQAVRALGRQLARVLWGMLKHERCYEAR